MFTNLKLLHLNFFKADLPYIFFYNISLFCIVNFYHILDNTSQTSWYNAFWWLVTSYLRTVLTVIKVDANYQTINVIPFNYKHPHFVDIYEPLSNKIPLHSPDLTVFFCICKVCYWNHFGTLHDSFWSATCCPSPFTNITYRPLVPPCLVRRLLLVPALSFTSTAVSQSLEHCILVKWCSSPRHVIFLRIVWLTSG